MGAKTALLAFADGELRSALRGAVRPDPAEAIDLVRGVSDWLGFAVWEGGRLVRSLSVSPDAGVRENIGEPYDFELPYWAGEHPVGSAISGDRYPLPFHPLELGEEALRGLFGFIIEGLPDPRTSIRSTSACTASGSRTRPAGNRRTARPRWHERHSR